MKMTNCARCGKVFNTGSGEIYCPSCAQEEAKDMRKVTDYLREHPLATVMEVQEKTGVSQAQILRFVKGGTLKIVKQPEHFNCRVCGKPIVKGTTCVECGSKIKGMEKKKHKQGN